MKRVLALIATAFFGLLAGILLIEGFFRVFPGLLPFSVSQQLQVTNVTLARISAAHHERATILAEDGYFGRIIKPGREIDITGHPDYSYHISTVSLGIGEAGFRDDGLQDDAYAVAVGDSFLFGDGVPMEQSWSELLETQSGYDVVNEGVPGYSAIQEMRMLAAYGLPLEPDVVIWSFFGNDPQGDVAFHQWLDSGEASYGLWQSTEATETPAQLPDPQTEIGRYLRDHSIVYDIVDLARYQPGELYQPYVDDSLALNFHFYTIWERYLDPTNETLVDGLGLSQFYILEGKRLAAEQGAAFVLVLVPFKEQVYWSQVSLTLPDAGSYDIDWMQSAMLAFCEAEGITCIDLLPVFREYATQGEQLYFRTDGHFNVAGHTLAAEEIYRQMSDTGLFP